MCQEPATHPVNCKHPSQFLCLPLSHSAGEATSRRQKVPLGDKAFCWDYHKSLCFHCCSFHSLKTVACVIEYQASPAQPTLTKAMLLYIPCSIYSVSLITFLFRSNLAFRIISHGLLNHNVLSVVLS